MNNPRPIIEWLNELPELIRELVIADCKANPFENYRNIKVGCMSNAILCALDWSETKIGALFYDKLYEDALYHEQNNIKLPR